VDKEISDALANAIRAVGPHGWRATTGQRCTNMMSPRDDLDRPRH
jgi:hypothetical protein